MAVRHISRADIEFYESRLLLSLARAMSPTALDGLSSRARLRRYDRALGILEQMLNDEATVQAMYRFSSLKLREIGRAP